MRIITDRPKTKAALQRLGWFVGLWLGGVLAIGAVATLLRLLMHSL